MARPLRLEFAGALYHITSRGNRQGDIYESDADRSAFIDLLGDVCDTCNWVCHAYCLMSNHYHLLIETPEANVSKGMRQLNGVYTQLYNRSHKRFGHVFQGRYKAIHVEKEAYLLELACYIVLNPVRASMVRTALEWSWSSYRATLGITKSPNWLNAEWLLAAFGSKKSEAIEGYKCFVSAGRNQPSPFQALRNQVFLGNDYFIEKMVGLIDGDKNLTEVPSSQRKPLPKRLDEYTAMTDTRNQTIKLAYKSGGYSMIEIANHFGLHYTSVSRIVKHAQ